MKKIIKKIIKAPEAVEVAHEEPTLYDEIQELIKEMDDDYEDASDTIDVSSKNSIRSPLKAIRKNCILCIGSIREVPNCTAEKSCPLFPFRMGKNPFRTPRVVTDEQREAARERFKRSRESKRGGSE